MTFDLLFVSLFIMELGSVFDGPLSSGEKSDKGMSVWQAEVALRLSKGLKISWHSINISV